MATGDKVDYYRLGKSLYETSWKRAKIDGRVGEMVAATATATGLSPATIYRAIYYYRVLVLNLGLGPDVYALGPYRLDRVLATFDWNHHEGRIGSGTGSKLGKAAARKLLKRLMEERGGVAA